MPMRRAWASVPPTISAAIYSRHPAPLSRGTGLTANTWEQPKRYRGVPVFDKILFAKIGWAPKFDGEACTGDFGEPNESTSWYERFNFLFGPEGRYYGYIPPMGPHGTPPKPTDKSGWLVIFLSRSGKGGPLLPVGWYEDATFEDGYRERPEYAHDPGFLRQRNQLPYTDRKSTRLNSSHLGISY